MLNYLIIISLFIFGFTNNEEIRAINSENIKGIIVSADKPTVIHYWVPNCGNSTEVLDELNKVYASNNEKIQFIFIAISYSDSLIKDRMIANNCQFKAYKLDTAEFKNLNYGIQGFNKKLLEMLGKKQSNFTAIAISNTFKYITKSNKVKITKGFLRSVK